MEKKNELTMEQMEEVTGGVIRTVNTGKQGLNAAVRLGPAKNTKQIASLPNGTAVDTISDKTVYDPVAGRNFVEVTFTDRDGTVRTGWIAASILGLPR